MEIDRWNEERDGSLTEESLRRKLERQGYRVSRYTYPPGTRFSVHSHQMDKIDAVLAGRFRMVIEGKEVILEAGDSVVVPRGVQHSAEVIGGKSVISLDAQKE